MNEPAIAELSPAAMVGSSSCAAVHPHDGRIDVTVTADSPVFSNGFFRAD
ncbi:MAG: hypothetical protein AAGE65_12520 [Planctomycetota bacterium]